MRTDNGMSRCFGFLTFKDPSVIDEILKKKHNLDGKDVNDIKWIYIYIE